MGHRDSARVVPSVIVKSSVTISKVNELVNSLIFAI
jgi:hypothetical protein